VVPFSPVTRASWEHNPDGVAAQLESDIGYPCFVKPANLGSSVGISKVRDWEQLRVALSLAAEFGGRLIVEEARDARELECGVLGNHDPEASVVGEVIPAREFYDYEAKYHDPQTRFMIPARIAADTQRDARALAIQAFKAIGGAGMARVDFFLDRSDGKLWVNEINTIPGFTSMSVYPRLWAASGISYPQLIDRLIQLALERYADQARNRTRYES
jgi:D-alanine-D-alanine ligase